MTADDSPTQINIEIPWSENLEKMAQEIGESSGAYKSMHLDEARYARRAYAGLMFLGIVLGPLSGILNSTGIVLDMRHNPYLALTEIACGFLSGIAVAVVKFAKYDEVSHANKSAAAKYASLESNVRRQLGLTRNVRVEANNYLHWLDSKYDELIASAPLIPNHIYNQYERRAAINGWRLPSQYSATIDINSDFVDTEKNAEILGFPKPKKKKSSDSGNDKMFSCKRSDAGKLSTITDINCFSDSMLEYEMHRMEKNVP